MDNTVYLYPYKNPNTAIYAVYNAVEIDGK